MTFVKLCSKPHSEPFIRLSNCHGFPEPTQVLENTQEKKEWEKVPDDYGNVYVPSFQLFSGVTINDSINFDIRRVIYIDFQS